MISSLSKINFLLDNKSKKQFAFLLLLLFFKSFLDGFGLGLIAPYIAAIADSTIILNNSFFKKLNLFLNIQNQQELVIYLSSFLIVFFILKNVFALLVSYFQSRLIFSSRSMLGKELFELYLNAPYKYHLEHNTAELDRNLRFENTNVFSYIQNTLILTSNIFLIISIFIVLMISNWKAVLGIGFFIGIVSFVFLSISGKYSKRLGIDVQSSQLDTGKAMKEGLSTVIDSKLLNIEFFFSEKIFKYMMINARANWRHVTLGAVPSLFFEILALSILVGFVFFIITNNIDLEKVLPILGLFSFAFVRLLPTVSVMIKNIQDIKFLMPSVDVIYSEFKNFSGETEYKSIEKTGNNLEVFKELKLENISFSYNRKEGNSINNLSLIINKGQSIGITGPSGSGKTTLINIILGLLKIDKGNIFVNGDLLINNFRNWHKLLGYVPQLITLTDSTIRENIAFGVSENEINDDQIWKSIKESNLLNFIENLPNGINTIIGENGVRLSGGQRQRLGLARALYRTPKILIFDEATSALDIESEKKITNEIMKLSGDRTIIIIAHRINTIKNCDIIYFMKEGKIKNYGTFDELKKIDNEFKNISINI